MQFLAIFSLNFLFGIVIAQANSSLAGEYGVFSPSDFKRHLEEAEKGNVDAQLIVANCYGTGCGVAPNMVQAVKWCLKAAEQGDVRAQFGIGLSYLIGRGGLAQNCYEAIKWFEKAAEQGDVESQHNLGELYSKGILRDYEKALKWFRRAAEQKDVEGIYNVGICYAKGWGVAQDFQEAIKWFQKAADQGFAQAKADLWYYNGKTLNQSKQDFFCTFTVYSNDQNIVIFCNQDIVSFAANFSNESISEFKSVGYRGLQESFQDKLKEHIQDQDYVEVLKYLRTENDLDRVLHFLEPYAKESHPILMLEMSRALCIKMAVQQSYSLANIKSAFQWYCLGLIYAELDIACNDDKTTSAAIGMLTNVYHPGKIIPSSELKRFFPNEKGLMKYLTTLLIELKPTLSYPSPKWVLYHGMKAFECKNTLIPQQEWNKVRLKRIQELQSDAKQVIEQFLLR